MKEVAGRAPGWAVDVWGEGVAGRRGCWVKRPCKQVAKDATHQVVDGLKGNTLSSAIGTREQQRRKGVASGGLDNLRPYPTLFIPSQDQAPPVLVHRAQYIGVGRQSGEMGANRHMCPHHH